MMAWLQGIVLILSGAAAAASISESSAKGHRRRREEAELRRGMILPREAARELEHRIGGRVAVGQDTVGYKLVIMRAEPYIGIPNTFLGYRVERQQQIRFRGRRSTT